MGTLRSLIEVIVEVVLGVAAVCTTGAWDSPFIFSLHDRRHRRRLRPRLRLRPAHRPRVGRSRSRIVELVPDAQRRPHPVLGRVEPRRHPRGARRRLRPPHLGRGRPPALPGPRPPRPPGRRQRPAVLAAPGHPDAAGVARPRRRARHHHRAAPGPVRLRLGRHPGPRRHRRQLAGDPPGERPPAPASMATEDLPPPIRSAVDRRDGGQRARPSTELGGPGLAPRPGSGLYAVLAARGAIIGLLAVEHTSERPLHAAATSSCSTASSSPSPWPSTTPAGSAACAPSAPTRSAPASPVTCTTASASRSPTWPSSSTASSTRDEQGDDLGPSLEQLRDDVRGVIREVRDTLYDLRTDVSDSQDMAAILEAYIDRVQDRSGSTIELFCDRDRPPADPAGARDVAHRPGGAHQRRAPRRGHPGPGRCGAATARRPPSRSPTTARASPSARPDASTPTGSSACASGRRASAPPSSSSSEVGRGTRVRCSLIQSADGERRSATSTARAVNASTCHGPRAVGHADWRPAPLGSSARRVRTDRADQLRGDPREHPPDAGRRPSDAARGAPTVDDRPGLRRRRRGRATATRPSAWPSELQPEVILMDVTMPEVDGVEATRQIRLEHPEIRIVMLTMHADQEVLASAIRAGASGYLVKDCSTEEIAAAVRMAASGETALSPQLAASRCSTRSAGSTARTRRRGAHRHPAGGRGPPAHRRRLLDPRGGREALHQPEDGEEPPGVDLPEARRPRPHAGRPPGRPHGHRPASTSSPQSAPGMWGPSR